MAASAAFLEALEWGSSEDTGKAAFVAADRAGIYYCSRVARGDSNEDALHAAAVVARAAAAIYSAHVASRKAVPGEELDRALHSVSLAADAAVTAARKRDLSVEGVTVFAYVCVMVMSRGGPLEDIEHVAECATLIIEKIYSFRDTDGGRLGNARQAANTAILEFGTAYRDALQRGMSSHLALQVSETHLVRIVDALLKD